LVVCVEHETNYVHESRWDLRSHPGHPHRPMNERVLPALRWRVPSIKPQPLPFILDTDLCAGDDTMNPSASPMIRFCCFALPGSGKVEDRPLSMGPLMPFAVRGLKWLESLFRLTNCETSGPRISPKKSTSNRRWHAC